MKKELTPEERANIERTSSSNPENPEKESFSYEDELRWLIILILNGEATAEAGRDDQGHVKWLKIYKINMETDRKENTLFYVDNKLADDLELTFQILQRNGIEPKFVTVPD